jgi:hypothetical protein
MAELQRTQSIGISIVNEQEVLNYVYTDAKPIEVIARLDLGITINNIAGPIAGGGAYLLKMYVNNILVTPITTDLVDPISATVVASRPLPIYSGDVVSIRVVGQLTDQHINVLATLRLFTPAQLSDLIGSGHVVVDHNYGGTDNLTVVSTTGARVANATISAFLASDYNAGRRTSAFVVGMTTTDVNGHWVQPLLLDPGAYILLVYKQGEFQSATVALTVS